MIGTQVTRLWAVVDTCLRCSSGVPEAGTPQAALPQEHLWNT